MKLKYLKKMGELCSLKIQLLSFYLYLPTSLFLYIQYVRTNLEKTNDHKEGYLVLEQCPILKLFYFDMVIHQLVCKTFRQLMSYKLKIN